MKDDFFMAYDIRGREITTHDAFLIGRALGSELEGDCFIGRDCREKSPLLSQHLIEGLRSSGIRVTNGGEMPNPAAYFNTFKKYDFGVYITASHLPANYSGFKIIMRDGSSIDPEILKKIKQRFIDYDFNKVDSEPVKQDITALNDYARFLEQEFGKLGTPCVIDCLNASGGYVTDTIFKQLLNAKVIRGKPLPDFNGVHPEPTEKNLKQLQEEVKNSSAYFGVGLDGDGDRSVFVDEKGEFIDGNKMTMLFAKNILEQKKGVIVAPVSVSKLLETKVVKPLGGKMVWCPVGHTFIEKELVKHKGLFGGEYSSHFYFNEFYPFSDGVMSTLMLARILKESGKKLSQLVAELPKVFVVKEEVEFDTHEQKQKAATLLVRNFLIQHPQALTMDGIKFMKDDACILLRPSQTCHTVKAFVEAEDKELAENVLADYVKIIESYK